MTWKYILIFIDRRWSSSVEHHHPRPILTPHSSHPPHVALGVVVRDLVCVAMHFSLPPLLLVGPAG